MEGNQPVPIGEYGSGALNHCAFVGSPVLAEDRIGDMISV